MWFFEKEYSRMQDSTPVYEGTIIEYQHTVKVSFGLTFRQSKVIVSMASSSPQNLLNYAVNNSVLLNECCL